MTNYKFRCIVKLQDRSRERFFMLHWCKKKATKNCHTLHFAFVVIFLEAAGSTIVYETYFYLDLSGYTINFSFSH